jgi:hypothetical protein
MQMPTPAHGFLSAVGSSDALQQIMRTCSPSQISLPTIEMCQQQPAAAASHHYLSKTSTPACPHPHRKLFQELAKVISGEQQTLCLQMVDEIEPSVRYCNYQLSRKGGAVVDPSQLLELAGGAGDLLQVGAACCSLAACCCWLHALPNPLRAGRLQPVLLW